MVQNSICPKCPFGNVLWFDAFWSFYFCFFHKLAFLKMLEITNEIFRTLILLIFVFLKRNIDESDDKRLFHQGERRFNLFDVYL